MLGRFSKALVLAAGIAIPPFTAGCSTAPSSEQGKEHIREDAEASLEQAKKSDSTLAKLLSDAAGYAVFPTVGKGAIGVGGAYGKGVLYERGSFVGYCDLSQASIGFQLGGQAYTEIIAFETTDAVQEFKNGDYSFNAQATAVALKSGAGANAKYKDGVAVFTVDEAGLMYEASIGGQRFSYLPK
jgi:lipid-binding SYLF domain-containing protein